jgi:hypothetical protein
MGGEELYLRLVVNPFLACTVVVLAVLLVRMVGRTGLSDGMRLTLSMFIVAGAMLLVGATLQYHCLDCGGIGRLTRWRGHMCPTVAERRLVGRPRRLRGPTPGIQLLVAVWAIALFGTLILNGMRAR